MAPLHAFASSRPTFTVPAIKRASVWRVAQSPAIGPADDELGSPARGVLIAAVLSAAIWYGILQLVF